MIDHTNEFLKYALAQIHPQVLEWYDTKTTQVQLLEDVKRDAEEFFRDEFGKEFSTNASELNIDAEHFKHRLLEVADKRLIAGIRFTGMDIHRPFVQVAGISQPITSNAERDQISAVLEREFNVFKPQRWRIFQASHQPYQFSGNDGDLRVLAGLLSNIKKRPLAEHARRIALRKAENLEFYPMYKDALETQYIHRPWLPDVARVETFEDMKHYLEHDQVWEIFVDEQWAGVTIASRGQEFGLRGWSMIEITLHPRWHGQGIAVHVQHQLGNALEDAGQDCLFGTIGAVNAPMQKTAARVGRVDIGGYVWVGLPV